MPIDIIYATFPNENEAKAIVELLLKEKLVACANIFPIQSHFFWENKAQNAAEFAAIFKTSCARATEVMTRIESEHSYEIPCIWKMTAETNLAFENWIGTQVNSKNIQ